MRNQKKITLTKYQQDLIPHQKITRFVHTVEILPVEIMYTDFMIKPERSSMYLKSELKDNNKAILSYRFLIVDKIIAHSFKARYRNET